MSEEIKEGEQKLYAGKYPTVEALEEGYKKSLPTFQENERLKNQLKELTSIPDSYNIPTDLTLADSDIDIVKAEAKNSGLTQAQFEKLARERNARSKSKHESFESAKNELGSDNLNLIQDFLKKTYPEKVADKVLKEAITDKEVREAILAQRNSVLNSSVPGIGSSPGYRTVTEKDALKARAEMEGLRGNARVEAQRKYIALQKELAHQKQRA
jgi:hypothetical protein